MGRDYVIEDRTSGNRPGVMHYRDVETGKGLGYQTEVEALRRLKAVVAHYNKHNGRSPGDLRVVERVTPVERWTCWGPVRGGCGKIHRMEEAAIRCCHKDAAACKSSFNQGAYSDRRPGKITRDTLGEVKEALSHDGDPTD